MSYRTAQLSADLEPSGAFVTVDGVQLHYRIIGQGPQAIALHGASGNLREWQAGPAQAIAEVATVLLLDRPGHGFSDRPKEAFDVTVQARLLRKAAEKLGFAGATLIGHSLGGATALAWATQFPESISGLLLVSSPSQVWERGTGLLYDLIANPVIGPVLVRTLPAFAGGKLIDDALVRIFAPQTAPPGYAQDIDARLALRPATARANALDITQLKATIRTLVPKYPALPMPVEMIHGTADVIVPAAVHSDKLIEQIPNARYTRLEGIGHMPHQVAPDALVAALKRLTAKA